MARPVQLPARGRAACEFRRLAVRRRLRPAPGPVRHRRRLESLHPPDLRRCGGLTALWLRALGLPLPAALVGGLAFTLAPYRVAQSTGHLLGPISMLLPLALYGVERRLGWLAAAALASIPLSGQVHLALGAIPFVLAYAIARGRPWLGGSRRGRRRRRRCDRLGALVARRGRAAVLGGRPLLRHAGRLRVPQPGRVRAVHLPRLAPPLLALAGLGCLCFRNTISSSRRLALVFGLGTLVPCLLALGENLPGYGLLWRNTPLHATRVPERMLPIACLCLAALAAAAIACVSETQARARGSSVRSRWCSSRPTSGCRCTTR